MSTVEDQQRGVSFRSSVEALKDAVPLAEYAAGLTDLRGAGGNLMGLCPLHDENTPSFLVYPDGHFHCYGCEAHGDVLDLHQIVNGYAEKWEALVSLATERGVEPPGRSDGWHASHERKRDIEELAMRARGEVYKRRAFRLLVLPAIDACYPEGGEDHDAELTRAWSGFGRPEFWVRVIAHMKAGARDGRIRRDDGSTP